MAKFKLGDSTNFFNKRKQKNRFTKIKKLKNLKLGTIGVLFLKGGLLSLSQIRRVRYYLIKVLGKSEKKKSRRVRIRILRMKKLHPRSIMELKKNLYSWWRPRYRLRYIRRNMWFSLFPNVVISRKSKNARMGKGKGCFTSWKIRVKAKSFFLRFRKFRLLKIKRFVKHIQHRISLKMYVHTVWKKSLGGRSLKNRQINTRIFYKYSA